MKIFSLVLLIVLTANWGKFSFPQYNFIQLEADSLKNKNTRIIEKKIRKYDLGHESPLLGEKAPDFSFTSFMGEKISLNSYKGKTILLVFWESWCGYCVKASLPELNKLHKELTDKEIQILGVVTENRDKARKIVSSNKIKFTNIYAAKTILKDYQISSRPTYVIIDKAGEIIFFSYGNLEIVKKKLKLSNK